MSQEDEKFYVGDLVTCEGVFTDKDGANIDPSTVAVKIKAPDQTVTTYVYNTHPELKREALGIFYIDVNANAPGIWRYRFYSTGNGQGAHENFFEVERSNFS